MGVVASKNKWLKLRRRNLAFHATHDRHVYISEDGKTAMCMVNQSDVSGRCYSSRTLRTNEMVGMSVRGSGFFDLGLTDVHPARFHVSKDSVFTHVVSKVLYCEPVELALSLDGDGGVLLEDGSDKAVRITLRAKGTTHWLVMTVGCGDMSVTLSTPERGTAEPAGKLSARASRPSARRF